jgi:type IV pilus assembly protein PilA
LHYDEKAETMKQNAFTLIELLVVIAIIGILSAVLIPNLLAARNTANERASQIYIRDVTNGVEIKRMSALDLPPVGTTCIELTERSGFPGSIQECWYVPGIGAQKGTYTVTVKSANGKFFQYDGNGIIALTSYTP